MTSKEKDLLLKDLCARLHYGVMIYVEHDWFEDEVPPYDALLTVERHSILNNFSENPLTCCLIIKPYLRPMSSMTDEEIDELTEYHIWNNGDRIFPDCNCELGDFIGAMEWFNKHHFDYRGLIEMGLALEAPEGMYQIATNK